MWGKFWTYAANRNTVNTKEQKKLKRKRYPSMSNNHNKNKGGHNIILDIEEIDLKT